MNDTPRLSLDAERAAGEEFARKCLEGVKMEARLSFTKTLYKNLCYSAEHTPDPIEKSKVEWARDYLKRLLDNECNWRY